MNQTSKFPPLDPKKVSQKWRQSQLLKIPRRVINWSLDKTQAAKLPQTKRED
jgi:hypothetical protein